MTNEEALKELDRKIELSTSIQKTEQSVIDYYCVVKKALEKQVPKKPTHDGIRHTCPTCNQPLPNVAHNNCMYCGQRIDWSEE